MSKCISDKNELCQHIFGEAGNREVFVDPKLIKEILEDDIAHCILDRCAGQNFTKKEFSDMDDREGNRSCKASFQGYAIGIYELGLDVNMRTPEIDFFVRNGRATRLPQEDWRSVFEGINLNKLGFSPLHHNHYHRAISGEEISNIDKLMEIVQTIITELSNAAEELKELLRQ
jgi:hypothetical protein